MLLYSEALLNPKAGADLNAFSCLWDDAAKGKIYWIRHYFWCPFLVSGPPHEGPVIHAKILAGFQKQLQAKYDVSSTIRHKGERGRSRETGVAGFLQENLPEAFGVGTGEVFSFNTEGISPQCDVIVYDQMRTPIFGRGKSVQQIPIEGVFAIVEVRSIIDSAALRDAEAKFRAIRELWQRAKPKNASRIRDNEGPAFFLFGFKLKATPKRCLSFLRDTRAEDTSLVALDAGHSIWVGPSNKSKPARPEWLITPDPEMGVYSALAFFYFGILAACQSEPQRLDFLNIWLSC